MSEAHEKLGNTEIRNYLIGCMYKHGTFSLLELRLLLLICRNTYGWQKSKNGNVRYDRFQCSLDEMATEMEVDKRNLRRTLKGLIDKNIIIAYEPGKGRRPGTYGINSETKTWKIDLSKNEPKSIGSRPKPNSVEGSNLPSLQNETTKLERVDSTLSKGSNLPSLQNVEGSNLPSKPPSQPNSHAGSSAPKKRSKKRSKKRGDFSSDFLFRISDRLWRQLQAFYSKDQQVKTEETFEQIHQAVTEHCGHPNFDQTWQALLTQQFAEEEADPTLASQPLRLLDRLAAELDRDRPERRKTA